jgi:hypothetical protein
MDWLKLLETLGPSLVQAVLPDKFKAFAPILAPIIIGAIHSAKG